MEQQMSDEANKTPAEMADRLSPLRFSESTGAQAQPLTSTGQAPSKPSEAPTTVLQKPKTAQELKDVAAFRAELDAAVKGATARRLAEMHKQGAASESDTKAAEELAPSFQQLVDSFDDDEADSDDQRDDHEPEAASALALKGPRAIPSILAADRPRQERQENSAAGSATGEVSKHPATGKNMARREGGKLPYHLIPPEFPLLLALVLDYGVDKYAPRNYEKGLPFDDLLRGAESHLNALKAGVTHDNESGLPHAAHAAWALLAVGMQMLREPKLEGLYRTSVERRRCGGLLSVAEQLMEESKQFGVLAEGVPTPRPWHELVADQRSKMKREA
jgi:hypothetical protein